MHQQRTLNCLKYVGRIRRIGENRLASRVGEAFAGTRRCGRRLLRRALPGAGTLLAFRTAAKYRQNDGVVLDVLARDEAFRVQRGQYVCDQEKQSEDRTLVADGRIEQAATGEVSKL